MSDELRVKGYKPRFLLAFQFLTIIPVKTDMTVDEADIAKSSSFFVLVGLIQGMMLVGTDLIAGLFFHPDLLIAMILLVLVLSSGGFHLDGLADTFDAIAVKSDGNILTVRQKRLSIMRDGSTGPIGVISIVFTLLLKYLSLKGISHLTPFTYYFSLLFLPVMPKWAMVIAMFYGRPVREEGLGRPFLSEVRFKELAISTVILLLLLILPLIFFSSTPKGIYIFYGVLLLAVYSFCRIGVSFFHKRFSGLTGDNLGAISEITEVIFLLMVIVWSRLFI